jgi:hypothetical protein
MPHASAMRGYLFMSECSHKNNVPEVVAFSTVNEIGLMLMAFETTSFSSLLVDFFKCYGLLPLNHL